MSYNTIGRNNPAMISLMDDDVNNKIKSLTFEQVIEAQKIRKEKNINERKNILKKAKL